MHKFDKGWLKPLERWFERQGRVLPWRDDPTLYRVWISEIMLQQTQVVTVIPYFERFIAKFPTLESLAQADEQEVFSHWAGLGYYSRARNLHRAAQEMAAKGVPTSRDGWLDLPGVGPYTAGAVVSIALDQPEAILDGNVERVFSRLCRVDRKKGEAVFKETLWDLSREGVREAARRGFRPSLFNQALMELGALVCKPKNPDCGKCPLSANCLAHQDGVEDRYPPKRERAPVIQVQETVHAYFNAHGELLLEKAPAGQWRSGLWDLPRAPRPELRAKCVDEVETKYVVTRHKVTRTTKVWRASGWTAAEKRADEAWISLERELEVPVGAALRKTLAAIGELIH